MIMDYDYDFDYDYGSYKDYYKCRLNCFIYFS